MLHNIICGKHITDPLNCLPTMSSRLERMQEDVQAVINSCQADPECPFKDFEVSEHFFSFRFTGKSKSRQYTFHVSDDYPEHTLMSCSDNGQPKTVSEPIPAIFNRITSELYKPLITYIQSSSSSSDEELMETENGPAGSAPLNRMVSNESTYTDCNSDLASDDWDDDYYYNDGGIDDEDEEIYMNPLLTHDMELVKQIFGEHSLSYRLFGAIDDIDVELHINMSFLDAEIAKAWKVIREEPIVIRLHLSVSRYLDATEPKVEVFQPSQKEKFGVGSQMRKIMEGFLSESWRKLSNDYLSTQYSPKSRPRKNSGNGSPPKKKLHTQLSNSEGSSSQSNARVGGVVDDGSLAQIIEMGFTAEISRNALIISRGVVEEALNLLISSPDSCKDIKFVSATSLPLPPIPTAASQSKHPRASRQHSHPKGTKEKGRSKPFAQRQTSSGYSSAPPSSADLEAASPLDDLNLLPSTTASGKNAKQVPVLHHGFLYQVMMYARQRLPTLNEYCVVCDEPHVFQNGAMLKPAVCARELCVFAFQTLGVMSDAAEDIATGAEVVDLLIAMAKAACTSHRKDFIFDPFPTVVDPHNPTELALHPKKKDFTRVEAALEHFPQMHNMTSLVGSELKKEMDRYDRLAYPLLQWIITSNRSHIVKLPPEKQLAFMHTPHQFLLMSSPPWKEAVFRTAMAKHGSCFAFHGSHIENWHSIMRIGLINASGTKHQMHGAAYGNGIYLSPHASVSFGYSGMGYGHHRPSKAAVGTGRQTKSGSSDMRFFKSKNLTCIALCEVITSGDLKKNGNIWVMPNPDHVCTRFFFVYEDGQVGDQNIDTQNEKYKSAIAQAVSFQTR